jgi:hypothetical protein
VSATERRRIRLWRKVGVGIKQARLDPFGDVAQELEKTGVVLGLADGFEMDDFGSFSANGHVEAEARLRLVEDGGKKEAS